MVGSDLSLTNVRLDIVILRQLFMCPYGVLANS